ncbi:MAG TPA: SPOR domain-containing protein [Acidobacteriaceae bacterium]|jgi:cell division septation protein DedD|nr:SPOR domain-containing protein [Acidobacteriaceae bacterium]
MAFLFETEEDEEAGRGRRTAGRRGRGGRDEDNEGAEITLGTRSLLGIFFGLVLVCSIFFGLGYSVGRGSAAKAAAAPSADGSTLAANGSLAKPSAQLTGAEAPGPDASSGTPEESAPALEPATTEAPAPAGAGSTAAATPAATVKPAGFPSEVPGAANAPVVRPAVATVVASGIMVQVAAISVPQDADILVDALKKRGYTAVIRNEAQDKLLHVQLGPFASRAEANAIRTKLLADGYNAVVK